MSIIKIVPESYLNPSCLEKLIHGYIFRKAIYYGGLSIDPAHAAEQMLLTKQIWLQTQGKQCRHFIVSLSDQESNLFPDPSMLLMPAYWICEHFADQYQIIFGIHTHPRLHIHFVMNTINFVTGKRFENKRMQDFELQTVVESAFSTGKAFIFYD